MKQYLSFTKSFLLLIAPAIASSILAASPSQAATFAFSEGDVEFTKFSQSPLTVGTEADTNTLTIVKDGAANAFADAQANFLVAPAKAFNSSFSKTFGAGIDYLGLAESEATVLGNFVVEPGTPFSFDFTAFLNLETFIDGLPRENATASGDISLFLIDTDNGSILDAFSLVGNLTTKGDDDYLIAFSESENFTLSNPFKDYNFGGKQEFATAYLQGVFQRSFDSQTNLSLVEVKRNQARAIATVPEPSSSLALLFCGGVIGVALKGRRKETTSAGWLERKVAAEV